MDCRGSRWQQDHQRQVDRFGRYFVSDDASLSKSQLHSRRSHPAASSSCSPLPQRALGRDFRSSHPSSTADWTRKGRPVASFEDFAVGFENEATELDVKGESGGGRLLMEGNGSDDVAFDEITQQIASLTQTVNELRLKHRRPIAQCFI